MVYALSEAEVRERLTADKLTAFQQHVQQQLANHGEIRVTIEKGIFWGIARDDIKILRY
jgi:hypothetical protein